MAERNRSGEMPRRGGFWHLITDEISVLPELEQAVYLDFYRDDFRTLGEMALRAIWEAVASQPYSAIALFFALIATVASHLSTILAIGLFTVSAILLAFNIGALIRWRGGDHTVTGPVRLSFVASTLTVLVVVVGLLVASALPALPTSADSIGPIGPITPTPPGGVGSGTLALTSALTTPYEVYESAVAAFLTTLYSYVPPEYKVYSSFDLAHNILVFVKGHWEIGAQLWIAAQGLRVFSKIEPAAVSIIYGVSKVLMSQNPPTAEELWESFVHFALKGAPNYKTCLAQSGNDYVKLYYCVRNGGWNAAINAWNNAVDQAGSVFSDAKISANDLAGLLDSKPYLHIYAPTGATHSENMWGAVAYKNLTAIAGRASVKEQMPVLPPPPGVETPTMTGTTAIPVPIPQYAVFGYGLLKALSAGTVLKLTAILAVLVFIWNLFYEVVKGGRRGQDALVAAFSEAMIMYFGTIILWYIFYIVFAGSYFPYAISKLMEQYASAVHVVTSAVILYAGEGLATARSLLIAFIIPFLRFSYVFQMAHLLVILFFFLAVVHFATLVAFALIPFSFLPTHPLFRFLTESANRFLAALIGIYVSIALLTGALQIFTLLLSSFFSVFSSLMGLLIASFFLKTLTDAISKLTQELINSTMRAG